jgi:glutathione S-transferase
MAARYELHGIWLSGPAYKVGLMLSLLGEPFDYVHVDLRSGAHKKPEYLAHQRFGQVPLLVDRKTGFELCQSASILEYLADQHGRMGGADALERLRAREWMYWDFDRLAMHIYRSRGSRLGLRSLSQSIMEMHFAEGTAALKVLDEHLAKHDWLVGGGPTIADVDLQGVLGYAGQGGFDLATVPYVAAWANRMAALPGFIEVTGLPRASRTA